MHLLLLFLLLFHYLFEHIHFDRLLILCSDICYSSCFLNSNSFFLISMSYSAFSLRNSTASLPLLLFFALLCPSSDFLFCVCPTVLIAVLRVSSAFSLSPSIFSFFSPSSRSCYSSADSSMAITVCFIVSSNSVFVGLVPLSFNSLASFRLNLWIKTPIWS